MRVAAISMVTPSDNGLHSIQLSALLSEQLSYLLWASVLWHQQWSHWILVGRTSWTVSLVEYLLWSSLQCGFVCHSHGPGDHLLSTQAQSELHRVLHLYFTWFKLVQELLHCPILLASQLKRLLGVNRLREVEARMEVEKTVGQSTTAFLWRSEAWGLTTRHSNPHFSFSIVLSERLVSSPS